MLKITLVFFASGIGGLLRLGVSEATRTFCAKIHPSLPLGTLIVNVSGCLVAGFLSALFASAAPIREEYRIAILVGLLGGYTTFSTFGRETLWLVEQRQWMLAATNVLLSVSLGLGGVWAGSRTAQWAWSA